MTSGDPTPHPPSVFATTRWTRVLASRGDSPEAKVALSDLCAAYYAPVVAFLRREGRDEDAARELAHEFFARVLERPAFGGADPARGRFRSYLLGALKHFLGNRRVHELREKRGGEAAHLPLSTDTESGFEGGVAPFTEPAADVLFDREWATALLDRALGTLQAEAEAQGNRREFDTLKPWLTGGGADKKQADAAHDLNASETAVRVAIHRLRRRFREVVKGEIAQTVAEPADVAGELQHLIAALS